MKKDERCGWCGQLFRLDPPEVQAKVVQDPKTGVSWHFPECIANDLAERIKDAARRYKREHEDQEDQTP